VANVVYNVAWIEPKPIDRRIGGEKWVALYCHHNGDDSPLIVQLPEQQWVAAVEKSMSKEDQ
jgi:hypothetical protein